MPVLTPGEHMQEFYIDANGVRHDPNTGNVVPDAGPQGFKRTDVAYYTSAGQPLRYADVYPGPVNVHVNKALTDISVAYEIDSKLFVAPEIAPVRTVQKRSDAYFVWARGDVSRDYGNAAQWSIGATANEINQAFDTATYLSVRYGFRDFLPDEVAANADEALQLATSITQFLTSVIEKGIEQRVIVNQMMGSGITGTTFSAATTGGAGNIQNATITTKYIQQAFNTAKSAIALANNGNQATHVLMNQDVAQRIAASPEIAQQVVYTMGEKYTEFGGWDGRQFGLPPTLYGLKVVVSAVVNNTAARGQTGSYSALVPATIGVYRVQQPSLKTQNCCTEFRIGGLMVRSYRDEPRKGTWIEVSVDQDEKLTNAFGGYLLTSA